MFILLIFFSCFSLFAHITLSGQSGEEYDVLNGYFYWKDIKVNLKDGKIDTIQANALYRYNDGTAINGRTWGIFLAEYGNSIEEQLFDGVKNTVSGQGINVPEDVTNKYKTIGQMYTVPDTFYQAQNSKSFQNITIPNEILKNASLDKDYRVYLWTDAGSGRTSFESCLGILTKVYITQLLIVGESQDYEIKSSFATMAILDEALNTKVLPLESAEFNEEKSGDLGKVSREKKYNLFYNHVHRTEDTKWNYTGKDNYIYAYCQEPKCINSVIPFKLEVDPYYEQDIIAKIKPDDATSKKLLWSSSDEDVVTVDENGHLKAF